MLKRSVAITCALFLLVAGAGTSGTPETSSAVTGHSLSHARVVFLHAR
jgi:hypothetical protein